MPWPLVRAAPQMRIKSGRFDFDDPAWESISDKARDLVINCLKVSVDDRYDIDEVLNHPWLSSASTRTTIVPAKRMSKFVMQKNTRRKMKSALYAVEASTRLSHGASGHLKSEANGPKPPDADGGLVPV